MRHNSETGFTLLEVLVALIIATLALTALFSGAVTGMRSASLAAHYIQAVSRARSHLAVLGVGSPLVTSTTQGVDGSGFHWRISIRPEETTSIAIRTGGLDRASKASRIAIYEINVSIAWSMDGGLRQVALHSQKIGPTPWLST